LGILAIIHSKSALIEAIGKELTYIEEKVKYFIGLTAAAIFAGGICDCRLARFK
jgi:hypothetical protein